MLPFDISRELSTFWDLTVQSIENELVHLLTRTTTHLVPVCYFCFNLPGTGAARPDSVSSPQLRLCPLRVRAPCRGIVPLYQIMVERHSLLGMSKFPSLPQ